MSSNDTRPTISVIVVTFNRVEWLSVALDSILAQTRPPMEVIVVDHGSTDDTAAFVATRAASSPLPIHYHFLADTGRLPMARAHGLARAHGDYVALLDDDDVWHVDKLARQVAGLAANPGAGLSYTDCRHLYRDGSVSTPLLREGQKHSGDIFVSLAGDCYIHPSTVLFDRRLAEEVGGFDGRLDCWELHLWLRMALRAPAIVLDWPAVYIRHHERQLSSESELLNYTRAIVSLEDVAARERLTRHQRRALRRALARFYAHLGRLQQSESAEVARPALLRSVVLNPWQKAAWLALATGLTR